MPAVVALPAFWGAVTAAAGGTAAIVGGKMQSNASREGANAQVAAANHAADLQSKSAADTLAFQKDQAALDQGRFETTQKANYDQWAAREHRLSDFGQALGLSARNIPAYQSSLPGGAPAGGPPAAGGDPKVAAFIANWQQTHPVSEGIAPIADALKQAGLSSGRFDYGGGKLSNNEVNVGGQPYKVLGGENTPAAYWYVPGTNDSAGGAARPAATTAVPAYASSFSSLLTPALQAPRINPYGVN